MYNAYTYIQYIQTYFCVYEYILYTNIHTSIVKVTFIINDSGYKCTFLGRPGGAPCHLLFS